MKMHARGLGGVFKALYRGQLQIWVHNPCGFYLFFEGLRGFRRARGNRIVVNHIFKGRREGVDETRQR